MNCLLTMQVYYQEYVLVHQLDQRCPQPLGMTRAMQPHRGLGGRASFRCFLVSNALPPCLHVCHLFLGLVSSSVSTVYFFTSCTPGQNWGTPDGLNNVYILSLVNMLTWQPRDDCGFHDRYKNLIHPFCHMRRWTLYCHFLCVEKYPFMFLFKFAFGRTSQLDLPNRF